MPSYGWLFDEKRCIECQACETACKQWNQVEVGINVRYRRVTVRHSGTFPMLQEQSLSSACNHCDTAWCMMVCPVKAITRRSEDGTIQIDQSRCVGCRQCAAFCPYQAPQFNERTMKMEKCTGCFDRIETGLEPACATICPTGALQFGEWDDIRTQGVDRVPNFTNPAQTRPHIRFITTPYPAGQ